MSGAITFLIGLAVGYLVLPRLIPTLKMSLGQFQGQLK